MADYTKASISFVSERDPADVIDQIRSAAIVHGWTLHEVAAGGVIRLRFAGDDD